jgi:hypothetical protein
MKRFTIFLVLFNTFLFVAGQSKIDFENQDLSGASVVYNGSISVISNPVTTGINASGYCLDVINNDYAPIKFSNFVIPAGAKSTYPYAKLKFKIAYKSFNNGTDLDYPQIDVFSSPENPTLSDAEKLGSINSAWGSHVSDSLVWRTAEFSFSTSSLSDIPEGILVLKLAKPKCEYLLDDIELIPSPTNNSNVITLFDFESNSINDVFPTINIYGGTVASSALVVEDPVVSHSGKSLQMSQTDYNQVIAFNVTLPTGEKLTNYDRLFFDRYSTSTNYAQAYIFANDIKIYQDESGYPSQGTANTWITKDYEITQNVPDANNFTLKIGYTSMNSDSYLIDNVKLHRIVTGIGEKTIIPFIVSCYGDYIHFSRLSERVDVFDVSGRLILTQKNAEKINVQQLPSGIYLVKAFVNGETFLSKVIR